MTAHPQQFMAAAAAMFDELGMPYQLTDESMTVEPSSPLRHVSVFSAKTDWVVLNSMLDAKIIEAQYSDALRVANRFHTEHHYLQAYIVPGRLGLVPVATVALPAFAFAETHATQTVALFVSATIQWVEWWAEHADLLELSPAEW